MKCKLQQPVKDFITFSLATIIFIGVLALIVCSIFYAVGYITIQSDICVVGARAFSSPAEVYLTQGITLVVGVVILGVTLFIIGSLLFSIYSFVKFLVRAIFIKGKERDWFKENIYKCEGN